ncbi:prenyltransferase [Radiobacillus kanasensis]|uniref:prenyltransferase n=1 Tax=Radiobacillus kanasensis TaxID=2844358 RepID=UPI001E479775|nr:prenyltransferase [Radiobacillus kanasensis]UFT98440.1 prenyltransferase [Radiobacillus kanasensis]
MRSTSFITHVKVGWIMLRMIAVVASSFTTIISTVLPLYLYYSVSAEKLYSILGLLVLAAFLIHGLLTHLLNDWADHRSGTDLHSPGILSGGSGVFQSGLVEEESLWRFAKQLMFFLSLGVVALLLIGYEKLAVLLLIGLWGAVSYSLPPFQFSYRPFTGEWLSTFPSVFALGLAGAWLALDSIPEWVIQNALINGLFCISWIMVHHIPDRYADQLATPIKVTSVVWFFRKFGAKYCRLPAIIYFCLTGLCSIWLGIDRFWAMIGLCFFVGISLILVITMNIEDHEQVSSHEKVILLIAMINGIWLGVFI